MDLAKIGGYIAGKRKALGWTQRQLAEKLGMSDKSVSKWERGVCLPDVSVYMELCGILGISINEFLAGEDIVAENMVKKSEENIISVTAEGKVRQKRLKGVIGLLLMLSLAATAVISAMLFNILRPRNAIEPLSRNSIEMKTAEMLSGADGVCMYNFVTTDKFDTIKLYITEYRAGEQIKKDELELSYGELGSPKQGTIIIMPEFERASIRFILVDDSGKVATKIPILEDMGEWEHLARSGTQIDRETAVRYGQEQMLAVFIYDQDVMRVGSVQDYEASRIPQENDYVYCFSVEFCK